MRAAPPDGEIAAPGADKLVRGKRFLAAHHAMNRLKTAGCSP